MEIKIVITTHAKQRIQERGASLAEVERIVRQVADNTSPTGNPVAINATSLPVLPIAKFFRKTAVVTTALPAGALLRRGTEVVYA